MHFLNFLNFRPLNNSLELWIIFLELAYPKGFFGKIKKNWIFRECLSILDILRKWLLNCYFFLSESHMRYGSEKCVSGLWFVAAALQQRPRTVKSGVRYS